jgi:hypothetical protein
VASDLLQLLIYFAIISVCTPLLGSYMARVFAGERTLLHRCWFRSSERSTAPPASKGRSLGLLGGPRINVMLPNLALDRMAEDHRGG